MTRQGVTGFSLAIVMLLSGACTVTEMDVSKTIGSSSASERSASRHDNKRDRQKEAAQTYVQLGLGYLRQGNRQRARLNLLKAVEKDKRSGDAQNALALLFQLEDEVALAEEHFKNAIRFEPEQTRFRYNYSRFLLRQKRYEAAFDEFTIASQAINYERRAQVFYSLGLIALQLGKTDEAKEAWEKSIKLNPQLSGPFMELAEVYFKLGDYPKSKRYLEHFDQSRKPSPRALWLAVRLEHEFGNKDAEASKALALRNMFPYSEETIEYKAWMKARHNGVKSSFSGSKDTLEYTDLQKAQ